MIITTATGFTINRRVNLHPYHVSNLYFQVLYSSYCSWCWRWLSHYGWLSKSLLPSPATLSLSRSVASWGNGNNFTLQHGTHPHLNRSSTLRFSINDTSFHYFRTHWSQDRAWLQLVIKEGDTYYKIFSWKCTVCAIIHRSSTCSRECRIIKSNGSWSCSSSCKKSCLTGRLYLTALLNGRYVPIAATAGRMYWNNYREKPAARLSQAKKLC